MTAYRHSFIVLGMRRMLLSLLLLVSPACASINPNSAPRDWPTLSVEVREVSQLEVIRRCSKYNPLALACAEVFFRTMTCVIWITPDAWKFVRDHEMDHCFGMDHYGDSSLRDAWANYKAGR